MRAELPELGLSFELPAGWREFAKGDRSAAFGPQEHAALGLADLPEGLYLKADDDDGVGLDRWAEAAMARHVSGGQPEWEEVHVGGTRARIASWTDGVADVLSTFIVRGQRRVLIELWGKGLEPECTLTIVGELRAFLARVLESAEWRLARDGTAN